MKFTIPKVLRSSHEQICTLNFSSYSLQEKNCLPFHPKRSMSLCNNPTQGAVGSGAVHPDAPAGDVMAAVRPGKNNNRNGGVR